MQLQVTGHHVEVTTAMKSFIAGKLAKLEEMFPRVQKAVVVVGNIYKPAAEYPREIDQALDQVNRFIGETVAQHGFRLADIYGAFRGHEQEYLCLGIEPTLKGATMIADLFERAMLQAETRSVE